MLNKTTLVGAWGAIISEEFPRVFQCSSLVQMTPNGPPMVHLNGPPKWSLKLSRYHDEVIQIRHLRSRLSKASPQLIL